MNCRFYINIIKSCNIVLIYFPIVLLFYFYFELKKIWNVLILTTPTILRCLCQCVLMCVVWLKRCVCVCVYVCVCDGVWCVNFIVSNATLCKIKLFYFFVNCVLLCVVWVCFHLRSMVVSWSYTCPYTCPYTRWIADFQVVFFRGVFFSGVFFSGVFKRSFFKWSF